MGATYQNNVDKDGGYLGQMKPQGGFLSKLKATGTIYQNNVDKYGGYLCQIKTRGLPREIGNNGGYLAKQCG